MNNQLFNHKLHEGAMEMHFHFRGRDFLRLADFTPEEILYIVDTAEDLKRRRAMGELFEPLRGKTVAMIFEKNSTRTRVSFQAGIAQLGGVSFYLRPDELQTSRGEPIGDTARIIDRYCDALVIRTFGQEIVDEFADFMRNPVINALTNDTHPCQVICDLLTIREKKGRFRGLKFAYTGDIYNISETLRMACAMTGMDFFAALPEGYKPKPNIEPFDMAELYAKLHGSKIVYSRDIEEIAADADVVYAQTWHSMAAENPEQRTKDFMPFQVNARVMAMAKQDAIFMHCLPGYRGQEMTDEVIEGPQSVTWDQGENRLHTEKAILALLLS